MLLVLFIVFAAIRTEQCAPFLILGSMIGTLFLYQGTFLTEWIDLMEKTIASQADLILICLFFGAIIALLTASRGNIHFAALLSRYCRSEKKTMLTTMLLSFFIFIDDYLCVLSIGTAMKGVYDKNKVPRSALSLTLCATEAVCVLCPLSSWARLLQL